MPARQDSADRTPLTDFLVVRVRCERLTLQTLARANSPDQQRQTTSCVVQVDHRVECGFPGFIAVPPAKPGAAAIGANTAKASPSQTSVFESKISRAGLRGDEGRISSWNPFSLKRRGTPQRVRPMSADRDRRVIVP
jgi:hypothetical protein